MKIENIEKTRNHVGECSNDMSDKRGNTRHAKTYFAINANFVYREEEGMAWKYKDDKNGVQYESGKFWFPNLLLEKLACPCKNKCALVIPEKEKSALAYIRTSIRSSDIIHMQEERIQTHGPIPCTHLFVFKSTLRGKPARVLSGTRCNKTIVFRRLVKQNLQPFKRKFVVPRSEQNLSET